MNDPDPILAELRKISAWADSQRKMNRRATIFLAIFIPLMIVAGVIAIYVDDKSQPEITLPIEKPDWYEVDQNVRHGDFDKAIRIGEELILKTPQRPESHRSLASAYLAAGKLDKAREHYAEAFRLFPSEENEKNLAAMDKRIKAENPQPR